MKHPKSLLGIFSYKAFRKTKEELKNFGKKFELIFAETTEVLVAVKYKLKKLNEDQSFGLRPTRKDYKFYVIF